MELIAHSPRRATARAGYPLALLELLRRKDPHGDFTGDALAAITTTIWEANTKCYHDGAKEVLQVEKEDGQRAALAEAQRARLPPHIGMVIKTRGLKRAAKPGQRS